MATQTFIPIGTVTFTSQSTITFGSLPQDYTHLFISIQGQASTTSNMLMRMNGDATSGNYNVLRFYAFGGGSSSDSGTSSGMELGNTYANQGNIQIDLFDYTATDAWKFALVKNTFNNSLFYQADQWTETNAVSSLTFETTSGTFSGTITVYGLHG